MTGLALTAARGQAASSPIEAPAFTTTGAFFALSVADLEASAKWYREKLGLAVVMRQPKANGAAVTVLEGGGLKVELLQLDAVPPAKAAPQVKGSLFVHGIAKVGVTVDDFERALSTLRSRGVEIAFGPYPARADQKANLIVRDNTGNLIQLFGK